MRRSLHLENTQGAHNPECLVPTVKQGGDCVMVWVARSWYSILLIPSLPFMAREYMNRLGNQVHPLIQTLFLNNDVVFHDDNAPIHTAETVQSWFEEKEGELKDLPWPTQSPDLNINEPLWSVMETSVRIRLHLQHL
jgi:hypothetical protein